ncbi:MAG: alpha amylase C-terminal domain-containing protein, partial [Myxococcota bacterium]
WEPNEYGGRENLEAVAFLREFNDAVHSEAPGCFTVAEESTTWPGVTSATDAGGLGFDLKWNMGWMHDTLNYMQKDPIHRRYHHDQLTFAMMYEHSERFVMPLSHDEVVHGKGSVHRRMPGDAWQKLANLRLLYAYQYTRPGKKLNFMGFEIPQQDEWSHMRSLDWHLREHEEEAKFGAFIRSLGRLYLSEPALWRQDYEREGYEWIDGSDRDNSVIAYIRRDGDRYCIVALNFTPIPRLGYRLGCPEEGPHRILLNSDDLDFGGSGVGTNPTVTPSDVPFHGRPASIVLDLPPLGAVVLRPERLS